MINIKIFDGNQKEQTFFFTEDTCIIRFPIIDF